MSFSTPTKASSGRTDGVVRANRWGALDSDSDDSPVCPGAPRKAPAPPVDYLRNFCATDPVFLAMERGDILWGDICYDPVRERAEAASCRLQARAQEAALESAEAALWRQPFARNLECNAGDNFDLRSLSDAEYEAFMRYLYANGFYVERESRDSCFATAATEEPRAWVQPSRFAGLEASPCACRPAPAAAALSAPGTDVGRRKGAPVPRFCRAATACADEGCRYVHGDTIPRVNLPCNFGAACGASDPTGVKRSQCLRMHPGEDWKEGLVIKRI
jgi:hypothetical protein